MSPFSDLSPVLIPVFALLIPIVGIVASAILKITRLNLLHETVRHLATHGQSIPAELLSKLSDSKAP